MIGKVCLKHSLLRFSIDSTASKFESWRPKDFVLEVIEAGLPFYSIRRKIAGYIKHFDSSDDPSLLVVCENSYLERQVQRLAARLLDRNDSGLKVYTTTVKALLGAKNRKTAVWSDVTEPEGLLALEGI